MQFFLVFLESPYARENLRRNMRARLTIRLATVVLVALSFMMMIVIMIGHSENAFFFCRNFVIVFCIAICHCFFCIVRVAKVCFVVALILVVDVVSVFD